MRNPSEVLVRNVQLAPMTISVVMMMVVRHIENCRPPTESAPAMGSSMDL